MAKVEMVFLRFCSLHTVAESRYSATLKLFLNLIFGSVPNLQYVENMQVYLLATLCCKCHIAN